MNSGNKTTTYVHVDADERTSSARTQRRPWGSTRQVMTPQGNDLRHARSVATTDETAGVEDVPSTRRLNAMRFGYAFMGVGLVIVKWPLLMDARSVPVMEGVVTSLLTAMSLLALLGLKYPVGMLPILLFEGAWKVIWLAAVAVPRALSDDMDAATREVLINCSFVVIILAVIPWGYAWRRYVITPGDAWR